MKKMPAHISAILALLIVAMCQQSCTSSTQTAVERQQLPDTLVVGTLYSPTSFFIYRGDTLGYDYDRICEFARDKKIALRFKVAQNMQSLLEYVKNDSVDLLAYEIPVTQEFNAQVLHCGETGTTYQVLVQPASGRKITNVTQLIGHEIHVEKGSKYESRLHNLNEELGGGIKVNAIESDTINAEDLIDQVSNGTIKYTIVDSDIAKLNKGYHNNINIDMPVSFPQHSSWAVNLNNNWLADTIDAWSTSKRTLLYAEDVSRHYFEQARTMGHSAFGTRHSKYVKRPGDISAFDELFRRYASSPYDWRLLAAIAKTESDFSPDAISWAGARGLMQIMPNSARGFGVSNADDLFDPEISVKVASKVLVQLDRYFAKYVNDPRERVRFVLAGYNGGMAHIVDAIKLAEKYDKNPTLWYGHVEDALKWKSIEKFYNDPVCHYGYFRSDETVKYVRTVEAHYGRY